MLREDTRRSSRPRLTKGKNAGGYNSSNFDYHEGNGGRGWVMWLNSYDGYQKQRRRRRLRKVMKRYGRRSDRQRLQEELRNEDLG